MTVPMLVLALVLALVAGTVRGELSVSRAIQVLDEFELKIDIDGCTSTDKYGCKALDTDWGRAISGNVHAALQEDLGAASHFKLQMKIKTGLFPVPFDLECKLCGAPCSFKIPVLEKEIDIKLPPCPLKASVADRKFSATIPAKDPVPVPLGFDGTVTIYDDKGKTLAVVQFSGKEKASEEVKFMLRHDRLVEE